MQNFHHTPPGDQQEQLQSTSGEKSHGQPQVFRLNLTAAQPCRSESDQQQVFPATSSGESLNARISFDKLNTSSFMQFIPCKVCGDCSSGVHYGVMSCEGCKGFFRRATEDKLSPECTEGHQIMLTRENRNRCRPCRLQACMDAGMKTTGCAYGRKSRREKAIIAQEALQEQFQKMCMLAINEEESKKQRLKYHSKRQKVESRRQMQRYQQQQRQHQQRKQQFEQNRQQSRLDQQQHLHHQQQSTKINQQHQQQRQPTQINQQNQQQPTRIELQQQMLHQQQHELCWPTCHQSVLPNNFFMDTPGSIQENVPITDNDCSGLINVVQNLDLNNGQNRSLNRNFAKRTPTPLDNRNELQPCTNVGNDQQRAINQQPYLHDQQQSSYIDYQQQARATHVKQEQQSSHHQQRQQQQQHDLLNSHQNVFQNLFVGPTGSMQENVPTSVNDFSSQTNLLHLDLNDDAHRSLNPNFASRIPTPKNNGNEQQPTANMENEHQLLVLTHSNSDGLFSVDK